MRLLTDLDKESFERLVNDLLYAELSGQGAVVPNPTLFGWTDGGVDARYSGPFRGTTGSWTVSVKGCTSLETLKHDLDDDFERHPERAWLVVTSFEPRTAPKRGSTKSEEAGLTTWLARHPHVRQPSHIVCGLEVKTWLRRSPFIARSYDLLDGGGDLYFRPAGDVAARRGDRAALPTRPRDLLDRVARALILERSRLVVVQGPLGLGQLDVAETLARDVFLRRAPWSEERLPVALLVDETWLPNSHELNRALRAELDLSRGTYLFVVPPSPRAAEIARELRARTQDGNHAVVAFLTAAQVEDQGIAPAPPRTQVFEIEPLRKEPADEEAIRQAVRAAPSSLYARWTYEQLTPLIWEAGGRIELAVDLATDHLLDRGMWLQEHLRPLLADLGLSLETARDALCVVALLAPVGVGGSEAEVRSLEGIATLVGCQAVELERLCGRLELWGLLQRRIWSSDLVWEPDAPLFTRALLQALWRGPRRARLTERLLGHEDAELAARRLMKVDDDLALRRVQGSARPVLWGDVPVARRALARLTRLTEMSPQVADAAVKVVAVGAERLSRAPREDESGAIADDAQEIPRTLRALLLTASSQGADAQRSTQALFDLLALDSASGFEALAEFGSRWARPPHQAPLATQTLVSLRGRLGEMSSPSWLAPLAVAIAAPWLRSARPVGPGTPLVGRIGADGWDERDEQLQDARRAAVELLIAMTGHTEQEVWRSAWRALGELWSEPTYAAPDRPMPPVVQELARDALCHAERQLSLELDWERRAVMERAALALVRRSDCPPESAANVVRQFLTDVRYLAWRWMLGDREVVSDTDLLSRSLEGGQDAVGVYELLPLYPPASDEFETWLAEGLAEQVTTVADLIELLVRVDDCAERVGPQSARRMLTGWMSRSLTLFQEVLFGVSWHQVPRSLRGILLDASADVSALDLREGVSRDVQEQEANGGVLSELLRLRHQPANTPADDLRELFPRLWRLLAPEQRVALFLSAADHPDPGAREAIAGEIDGWQCHRSPRPAREDVACAIGRLTTGPQGAAATRCLLEKVSYYEDDSEDLVAAAVGLALLEHPEALRFTCSHVNYPGHPHAEARVMTAAMRAEPDLWIQRVRQIPAERASWFVAPVEPALAERVLRRWTFAYDVEDRDHAALYRLVDRADPDDTVRIVGELVQESRSKAAAAVLTMVAPSATAPYAEAVCAVMGAQDPPDRDALVAGIRARLCGAWSGEAPVTWWRQVAACLDDRGQRVQGQVSDALRRLTLDIERTCTVYAPREA